ncbi:MAG: hydrogenase maturation protease [Planctomycetota bacterium]
MRVELNSMGYLLLDAETATACFGAAEGALVEMTGEDLVLTAIGPRAVGGLMLKQRNARGDRSVLVVEQIRGATWSAGQREASWDAGARVLRVPLVAESVDAR